MRTISEIKLPARLENLGDLLNSVTSAARIEGFEDRMGQIELATEEAIVNICNYAYAGEAGEVELTCKGDKDSFIIEIVNFGIPFDITSVADPDISAGLSDRHIGGLGIFFIRKMMDDVQFTRQGERNILKLIVNRKENAS